MANGRLHGKRVFVTQAGDFMGPVLAEVLAEHGATVIPDHRVMTEPHLPDQVIAAAGRVDVLIANLAVPRLRTPATEVSDREWRETFATLVDPLPRLCRAVLPQMVARRSGKIILMGSASALRGIAEATTYSAARGAQLAYAQTLGVEMAPYNIQVNAVAQNFVDNPTYFPQALQDDPAFQDRLRREVPLGRLVAAREDAEFVAYLCSDAANCFVGQVFPLCGGWAVR